MKLDVIVPTYNRSQSLELLLLSLDKAVKPANLEIEITVVDNNSTDNTRQLVKNMQKNISVKLSYLFCEQQGKCFALNQALYSTNGDWIGTVDDDEEVHINWIVHLHEALINDSTDFIGGPCYAKDDNLILPEWIPDNDCISVIGILIPSTEKLQYRSGEGPMAGGGNFAIKRKVVEEIGIYDIAFSMFLGKGRTICEDQDYFERLIKNNKTGYYLPEFIIYHEIPKKRISKKYFRQWSFNHGIGQALLFQKHRIKVSYLLGIPRYFIGSAVKSLSQLLRLRSPLSEHQRFLCILNIWQTCGMLLGSLKYQFLKRFLKVSWI